MKPQMPRHIDVVPWRSPSTRERTNTVDWSLKDRVDGIAFHGQAVHNLTEIGARTLAPAVAAELRRNLAGHVQRMLDMAEPPAGPLAGNALAEVQVAKARVEALRASAVLVSESPGVAHCLAMLSRLAGDPAPI